MPTTIHDLFAPPPAIIEIELSHYSSTGARYKVFHDGALLLKSAREPFCAGARELQARGLSGPLAMCRRGSRQMDLTGTIEGAALLTVTEGQVGQPRFAKWSPYDAQG